MVDWMLCVAVRMLVYVFLESGSSNRALMPVLNQFHTLDFLLLHLLRMASGAVL